MLVFREEKGTHSVSEGCSDLGRGSPGVLGSGGEDCSSLWGSPISGESSPGGLWPVPWDCLLPRMLYIVFLRENRDAWGWQPCHYGPLPSSPPLRELRPRPHPQSCPDVCQTPGTWHETWPPATSDPPPPSHFFHHTYHLPHTILLTNNTSLTPLPPTLLLVYKFHEGRKVCFVHWSTVNA